MTEFSQPMQPEPAAGEPHDRPITGPEFQDPVETEQQPEVSRETIEALARETAQLHAVCGTIDGIETAVMYDGWQTIAVDGRYGAEAILRACGVGSDGIPNVVSMSRFFERLGLDRGFSTYGIDEQHLPREDRPTKIHIHDVEEASA